MAFKRKQIYLDVTSDSKIRKLARATGLSEAEHIRRAIASYVADMPEVSGSAGPLIQMIGICNSKTGPVDSALHHDKYLYGRKR